MRFKLDDYKSGTRRYGVASAKKPAVSTSFGAGQSGNQSGRNLTTGRFATRGELVDAVCREYYLGKRTNAQLQRYCQISAPTMHKIISGDEGELWRHNYADQVNRRLHDLHDL